MHMRVLLFRVFFVIPLYIILNIHFFLVMGEKILCSLTPFACLSMFRLPKLSALFVRNICFHRCILCLLLPNCIRVLFPKKVLLLRFPFPCTYPIPLGLKTKEEPRTNQGTPKERPTTQKCFLLRLATSKKSLLR